MTRFGACFIVYIDKWVGLAYQALNNKKAMLSQGNRAMPL